MRAGRSENFRLAVIARLASHKCYASLIAVSLAGLSLSGCVERRQVAIQDVTVAPVIPEVSLPVLPRYRTRWIPPKPIARMRREGPEKKVAGFDPVILVGMAPPDISRILGNPIDMREEALSTEWIYSAPACSLVIFFYPDISTGALRALKYNVNDANAGAGRACVQQVLLAKGNDHG